MSKLAFSRMRIPMMLLTPYVVPAAWLAGALGVGGLLLVKHGRFEGVAIDAQDLVARGVVDPLFPRYLKESGAQAWLAGPTDSASLGEGLRGGIFPEIVAATSIRPPAAQ